MNPFTTNGAFSWSELLAADADAAVSYYRAVLGWDHQQMPMGDSGVYHIMRAGATNACGIMMRPEASIPPCWTYYITVDDIDQLAASAESAGATLIVPVMDAGGVGRFCGFEDPFGAYLSAISYHDASGDGQVNDFSLAFSTHGLFSWLELRTPQVPEAVEFYSALFGWTVTKESMPTGPYHVIRVGEVGIGGITTPPAPGMPPHWGGYVTVRDVDAVEQAAKAAGATIAVPAFDVESVGRMVHMLDPEGAALAAIAYAPPTSG